MTLDAMEGSVNPSNGNGELTREVLRAEMRAGLAEQWKEITRDLDGRFKPVNDHIQRIDRGEFTEAQKAGIVAVIKEDRVERADIRNLRLPIFALLISLLTLAGLSVQTLAGLGVI